MNASDKRKSITHHIRASSSSRNSAVIAAPPRAQFIRPASTSTSPAVDNDSSHEQSSPSSMGKDGSGAQAAKEREKTLQEKIAELKRELAANEAEFTRALDRLSQNESETASYWQAKYSTLNQQFLRVDTELRVLRTEVDVREAEKTELRDQWELLQRDLGERDSEIVLLRSQITGMLCFAGLVQCLLILVTGSTETVNEWRAMTLSLLRKECAPKMQQETDAVIHNVIARVNCILDSITDAKATDVRDQALRALVTNSINLARLLVAQKAMFRVTMPKIMPHQMILFEADKMEHIGEEDEDSLTAREIRCVTFPGIMKAGDENGKHLQYLNVIAKATVLCSPE